MGKVRYRGVLRWDNGWYIKKVKENIPPTDGTADHLSWPYNDGRWLAWWRWFFRDLEWETDLDLVHIVRTHQELNYRRFQRKLKDNIDRARAKRAIKVVQKMVSHE